MKKGLLIALAFFFLGAPHSYAAFAYKASITIDHTKVGSSDSSNFPVLVSGTYDGTGGTPNLKSAGNSGHVQSSSGYDIYFYSDSALTTRIPAERESYTASTGAVIFWVKVSTLSHTSNTVIYMAYGDSSISTDPNTDGTYGKTSTWESNFKSVRHYPDGSSLTTNDSTSNNNSATVTGSPTPSATTGQIDGGISFTSADSQAVLGANIVNASPITISAWVYWAAVPGSSSFIIGQSNGDGGGANSADIYIDSAGKINWYAYNGGAYTATSASAPSTGHWHYIVGTIGSTNNQVIYVDGSSAGTVANSAHYTGFGDPDMLEGGHTAFAGSSYMTMSLDETRFAATERSADWILAEYNNQSSPSTFYTMGSEMSTVTTTVVPRFNFFEGLWEFLSGQWRIL